MKYVQLIFQKFELWKTNNYLSDCKQRKRSWHYLAVKKLSALSKRVTSKYNGDFYFLNCVHSFRTENKSHMKKYVQ